jgi:Na+-translocating ferredoxin:NAD+ oxidoreductase subunit B
MTVADAAMGLHLNWAGLMMRTVQEGRGASRPALLLCGHEARWYVLTVNIDSGGAFMDDEYERLADALDRLANGFPRTESGVELRLLRKMLTPEEASLAAVMTATPEPIARIAARGAMDIHRAALMLKDLARRELVWVSSKPGARGFRLAPFVVGSYERTMLTAPDAEFAQLVEEYFCGGGAALMMAQPAIHRVLPARAAVKSEWVLPYDDVRAILLGARSFVVGDCVCRTQQDLLESRRCDFPVKACLWFSNSEDPSLEGASSQEEALAFLDQIEKIGLVHTVSNVMDGVGYVCNCCGCCCGLLRGIGEWGIDHSVAQANYFAEIDPDSCSGCAVCLARCQVDAITEESGRYVVDRARCIGCGLCVTGCGDKAASLRPKPPQEIVAPPPNFAAWEQQRLEHRGLA